MTQPSTYLRWMWRCALALSASGAACASTSRGSIVTVDGEQIAETQVMDVEVVVQKCQVPELKTYFAFDSDEVAEHANLDALARCLTTGPLQGHDIVLTGHTDPLGNEGYNVQLGLARARKVASHLVAQGVEKERIRYQSLGKRYASQDPSQFPKDRRVDIRILF